MINLKETAKQNLANAQKAYDESHKDDPKSDHPYDDAQLKAIDKRIAVLSEAGNSVTMISHAVGISKTYVADKLGVTPNVSSQSNTGSISTEDSHPAGSPAVGSE
jgi:hypothetical protein